MADYIRIDSGSFDSVFLVVDLPPNHQNGSVKNRFPITHIVYLNKDIRLTIDISLLNCV